MIIVICCEKGGSGKSSLAQSLTVFLKQAGEDVLLVDADPQRTSSEWASERSEGLLSPVPCVEKTGNISNDLQDLDSRYGFIIVDCGGADSKAMRSALSVSDATLIPFRPKRRDLRTAVKMADIIETVLAINPSLYVRSVVTQTPTLPSQYKRIDSAKALLASLELNPLEHFTRNLNSWDDCDEQGCSVLEYTEDPKAGEDAKAVFLEFLGGIPSE